MFGRYARHFDHTWRLAKEWTDDNRERTAPGTMADARLVETEVLVPKPKRFVREALIMPDGYELDWYYVDTPPSVLAVPVTADGNLVMVRQYRHNLKAYALEFRRHGRQGRGPAWPPCASSRRRPATPWQTGRSCRPSVRSTRCRPRRTSTPISMWPPGHALGPAPATPRLRSTSI